MHKGWITKSINKLFNKSLGVSDDEALFDKIRNATRSMVKGTKVTYTTAMKFADVYTCIRIKSESVGQLPIKLYRVKDAVRQQVYSGREHDIFTRRPNQYQTWQEFIEVYVTVIELRGNFYAEVKRNRYGNVYEIIPFRWQDNVSVNMDMNGTVTYHYTTNDGKGMTSTATYAARDILHIKLNSTDGVMGMSPISQAADEIGLGIAGSHHAASLFNNGARPSGVLYTDQVFGDDDDSIARITKSWTKAHGGVGNSGKTAILEAGLKYQSVQMTSVDAQLIEHSRFTREKIAAIFRIPLHMLNDTSAMKYNTVEHNNTSFFRDALMPLVTKLENNINILLPANHIIVVDEAQFVRGDRQTQVQTLTSELKSGLVTLNEGRIILGHEPVDGGDVFAIQTNNLMFGSYSDIGRLRELEISKLQGESDKVNNEASGMIVPPKVTSTKFDNN